MTTFAKSISRVAMLISLAIGHVGFAQLSVKEVIRDPANASAPARTKTILSQSQNKMIVDEHLYFSPYNTYSDGHGQLLANNVREGSSYAMWNNPGAYLKTTFTGTSATLDIEVTGNPLEQPAKLRWSIDDAPWTTERVSFGKHSQVVATSLSKGIHSLVLIYAASDENVSRWRDPVAALKIYGINLDEGETLADPARSSALPKKNVIFFGDSITEGAWVYGNSNRRIDRKYIDWVLYSDASVAWPRAVAAALGAEYGTCGFGGTGWITSPNPYVPPLPQSWNSYFKDQARLENGKLDPSPDYVIVNLGTNDPDQDLSGVIEGWFQKVRIATESTVPIVVLVPFNGHNRASLKEAVEAIHDLHVHFIDLGPDWSYGVSNYGHASMRSMDGLHPSAEATAEYAAAIAASIARVVDR